MASRAGLVVEGLGLERGGRTILRDLAFSVAPGTALMVVGANGSGKSTLLRGLAGLLPAMTGRIAWVGSDAADEPLAEHAHYLGHTDGLKGALTTRANLAFAAAWIGSAGLPPDAALDAVGLGALASFPLRVLSAGQRRRVALARLLVAHRPLWLLDEPATALDAAAEATLARLIRSHLAGGGAVVAATHGPLDVPSRTLRLGVP